MDNVIKRIDEKTRVIAHFNKEHNKDPQIPPWVVKAKGETFYVHHFEVDPGIGFSSKETPDNPATKASLMFKGCLTIYQKEDSIEARIGS